MNRQMARPLNRMRRTGLAAVLLVTGLVTASAQDMQDVEIKTTPIRDGLYMLTGRGGNLGLSIGDDGAFLIDDQYAPLTDKILAAIARLTDKPVRFVINTHWHGDHVGGNENMGKAGALIVAHENVRKRMSTEQFNRVFNRSTPPSPAGALPVVTFTRDVTFHWNGEEIHVFHVDPAHTDGDAVVHFKKAGVFHMGDTFFNSLYPFVDISAGGSVHGLVAAADRVLGLVDGTSRIIPGHGALAGRRELQAYRDMLNTVQQRITKLIAAGKSSDEVVAAKPTEEYDAQWGGGFMQPDRWVGIVYMSLAGAH